jgi:hypothetical protein
MMTMTVIELRYGGTSVHMATQSNLTQAASESGSYDDRTGCAQVVALELEGEGSRVV